MWKLVKNTNGLTELYPPSGIGFIYLAGKYQVMSLFGVDDLNKLDSNIYFYRFTDFEAVINQTLSQFFQDYYDLNWYKTWYFSRRLEDFIFISEFHSSKDDHIELRRWIINSPVPSIEVQLRHLPKNHSARSICHPSEVSIIGEKRKIDDIIFTAIIDSFPGISKEFLQAELSQILTNNLDNVAN